MDQKKPISEKQSLVSDEAVLSPQTMTAISIVVAVLAVLATIAIIYFKYMRKSVNTVLIVGLSDTGKTCIFSKLAKKNANPVTYTSLQENAIDLQVKGKPLKLVDFPGAERLRKLLVEKWLNANRSTLRGILFVIDSATFSKRARDVAEFLYDVVLETGKNVPIMVACNKQDLDLAKTDQVIRTTLEKEFTLINRSRFSALAGTDGGDGQKQRKTLSDPTEEFRWRMIDKPIEFASCTAIGESGDGMEAVRKWVLH